MVVGGHIQVTLVLGRQGADGRQQRQDRTISGIDPPILGQADEKVRALLTTGLQEVEDITIAVAYVDPGAARRRRKRPR
jgi:hypothetical protein